MYKNIFQKIFSKPFLFAILFFFLISSFPEFAFAAQKRSGSLHADPTCIPKGEIILNKYLNATTAASYECTSDGKTTTYVCTENSLLCSDNPQEDDDLIDWTSLLSWIGEGIVGLTSLLVVKVILDPINWVLELIITLTSFILDYTIYFTIVKFKQNFADLRFDVTNGLATENGSIGGYLIGSAGSGNDLIYYLWGILRDILNVIIFITIIYHAVRSMFEGFESTRKKFVVLLVFSIVVNFSLLFVKMAIDFSNILALQAYTLSIKPSGTENILEFRTPYGPPGTPASFGEYFKKSISFGLLNTVNTNSSTTTLEKLKNETSDLENGFIYNLALIFVNLGLIYILLFVTGILLMRALYFLYAMILAPLLAADIFFGIFKQSDKMASFAESLRRITNTVRGDFYESLVKGPILLFFLFLIGLFASVIFNNSAAKEMQEIAKNADGLSTLSEATILGLAMLFKFGIFFAFCMITFKQIDGITKSLFGEGGKNLTNLGKGFANFAFGRGLGGAARFAGLGLQNTVGRLASNSKTLNSLSNRTLDWRNADPNTVSGILKRGLGSSVFKTINGIQNGTYDAGNLVGKANKLSGGTLAKGLKGVTGSDINFGKRVTDSVADRDKAALDARKAARDKNIKEAESGDKVTTADIEKAKKEKTIKFGGQSFTVSEFEKFVDSPPKFTEVDGKFVDSTGGLKLSKDDFEKLTRGDADILLKIKEGKDKESQFAKEAAQHRGERRVEHITEEYKSGDRKGVGITGKLTDRAAFRNADTSTGLRLDTAKMMQKHAKDKVGENKKIVGFITGTFGTSVSSLIKDINSIADKQIKAIPSGLTPPEKAIRTYVIQTERDSMTKDLKEFMSTIPSYYTSDTKKLASNIEKFDSDDSPTGFKKILDAKKKAHEYVIAAATGLGKTAGIDKDLDALYKNIGKRNASLSEMEELYKKAKPAEHGKDDAHSGGKDAKDAGKAKDKPAEKH